jgi:hypothetical protein
MMLWGMLMGLLCSPKTIRASCRTTYIRMLPVTFGLAKGMRISPLVAVCLAVFGAYKPGLIKVHLIASAHNGPNVVLSVVF